MNTNTNLLLAAVPATALLVYLCRDKRSRTLPPGPSPLPIVGNLLALLAVPGASIYEDGVPDSALSKDVSKSSITPLHAAVAQWAKSYGPIIHVRAISQHIIFLTSSQAVTDLLDKRGAVYSDRPHLVMAGEMCGCKDIAAFTSYGEQFKRQRRFITPAMSARAMSGYEPLIQKQVLVFLKALVADPVNYPRLKALARRYSGGFTLGALYGYEPVPLGREVGAKDPDPFIQLASESMAHLQNDILSGSLLWPVDLLPWVRYIPSFFPGMAFKRKAKVWKAKMNEFANAPWRYVLSAMKSGDHTDSMCSMHLEDQERKNLEPSEAFLEDLKYSANSLNGTSSATMTSTVLSFILAISNHPEYAVIAQKEIDDVTKGLRLPTLADKESLPYVSAIFKETLRWSTAVPLGIPHRLMEDDHYQGMWMPKGSIVISDVWALTHDETVYPDPHAFKPERFMEREGHETQADPRTFVFGFGRRRCPGAALVDSSAWLIIATTLATFNVSRKERDVKWQGGFFRTPAPFDFAMTPRSNGAVENLSHGFE